jgi:3'(2'), 5'-bisphosphate nucleotidase
LASNEILINGLSTRWPQIPVLSEESVNGFADGDRPELYWAVDPLDGTKEFLNGNKEFTVNVALVNNGMPQLGVVGAPALGLLYWGACGEINNYCSKAKKRDAAGWQSIKVSGIGTNQFGDRPLRVAMSRSHPSEELSKWLKQFDNVDELYIGSSLKFCLLAEGAVDVYPRFGTTCIWDTAAAHAVVVAAGGCVIELDGTNLLYHQPSNTLNPFFIALGSNELAEKSLNLT